MKEPHTPCPREAPEGAPHGRLGRGGPGRYGRRHHGNLLKNEHYAHFDVSEKLFMMLQELGFICRFHFESKGGQGRILHILARENAAGQRDLTERLGIQPGSMSEVLSKLERNGYITRAADENDRRSVTVRITDAGREKSAALDAEGRMDARRMFSSLTEEERAQFLALAEKVYADWQESRGTGEGD